MISKVIFIALFVLICGTIIKDKSPSFSVIVYLFGVALITYEVLPYINDIYTKINAYISIINVDDVIFLPVFKVVIIAVISKIMAEVCRDRGERALGYKVELAGVVASILASFPLLDKAMKIIGAI